LIAKQEIFQLLQAAPGGLTSVEIAAGLGVSSHRVGGRLSKLAAYGEIEKLKNLLPSDKTKWRLISNRK
jgi:Mn-dependent DtxR family transcriptional regulator